MSTGFTFGAKPTTPAFGQNTFGSPSTGSITFGTPAVQNPTPFGMTTQPTQPSTGFGSSTFGSTLFGTPTSTMQNVRLTTGAPVTSSGGFSFGSTPASAAPSTGLSFGAPTNQAPTATPSFGFGTAAASATGVGSTFGFGTPASTTTAPAPSFGFGTAATTTTAAAPSFGFGTPASTTTAAAPSFGFGTPPSTGLSFGATPATTAATNFGFSTPATTGLGFLGATTTAAPTPSFGFNTPSTQPALNLGQPQTTTTTASSLFSTTPFAFSTTTTASAPTLNFSAPTTTSATMFNMPAPNTTATSTAGGLNFNLGSATQTNPLSFGLGGNTFSLSFTKPATTVTTSSVGLGGIVQSTPKSDASTPSKPELIPRDQQVPNEIQQILEKFKTTMKEQKASSSDVTRSSMKDVRKVAADIDAAGAALTDIEKHVQNNKLVTEKLKIDTAKALQHIEMAQRTMDTPPGFQYDNVMPMMYLKELVDGFEREMQNLRAQLEYTDKYVRNIEKPVPLTPQDLTMGIKRIHETFVSLTGRFQTVHNQVESQREQYLNFRKYMLNDDRNVFESSDQPNVLNITLSSFDYRPPAVASGPSPFTSLSNPSGIQSAVQNQNQTGTSTGFGITQQPVNNTTGTSIFGNTSTLNTAIGQPTLQFNAPTNTNFQLQKAPETRNKRGKQSGSRYSLIF